MVRYYSVLTVVSLINILIRFFLELGFVLKGTFYPPNSSINYANIGRDNEALRCVSPVLSCCRSSEPRWLLPNGTSVLRNRGNKNVYRTRNDSSVDLHRTIDAYMPTGLYTCIIFKTTNQITRLHIYLQLPGMRYLSKIKVKNIKYLVTIITKVNS